MQCCLALGIVLCTRIRTDGRPRLWYWQ